MPRNSGFAALSFLLLLAACGGERNEEREVMKPEDTVFGDLVTAPGKVEDRTQAAMELHREALQKQLRESEGAPPEE